METKSVKVSSELHAKLKEVAKRDGHSVMFLLNKAIKNLLIAKKEI